MGSPIDWSTGNLGMELLHDDVISYVLFSEPLEGREIPSDWTRFLSASTEVRRRFTRPVTPRRFAQVIVGPQLSPGRCPPLARFCPFTIILETLPRILSDTIHANSAASCEI
jgi:hypothetical protein